MTKYESEVKKVYAPQQAVYDKLSDLSRLSSIREKAGDPMFRQQVEQMAGDKLKPGQLDDVVNVLQTMEFTPDSLSVQIRALGQITMRIVEREEPKCVKYELEGAPIQATLWIQMLERDGCTLIKCTVGTELNFLLRQMVGGKIKDGVNQLASILASMPY